METITTATTGNQQHTSNRSVIKMSDELHAIITRTKAITLAAEINFLEGCQGYHALKEQDIASILWQAERNLDEMEKLANDMWDQHKRELAAAQAEPLKM